MIILPGKKLTEEVGDKGYVDRHFHEGPVLREFTSQPAHLKYLLIHVDRDTGKVQSWHLLESEGERQKAEKAILCTVEKKDGGPATIDGIVIYDELLL